MFIYTLLLTLKQKCRNWGCTSGQPNFGGETLQGTLGQKVCAYQFLLNSNHIWPCGRSSKAPLIGLIRTTELQTTELQPRGETLSECNNIGTHSPCGPRFPVEFKTCFPRKLGWPFNNSITKLLKSIFTKIWLLNYWILVIELLKF